MDIHTIPIPKLTSQFDTTISALADIGLEQTLYAARSYIFEAGLFVNAQALGGSKYAVSGSFTASSIIYEVMLLDNTTNAYTITSRQTALGGSVGQAGTTAGFCLIKGMVSVSSNAGGTFNVQFAQNAVSGTSSILPGSYLNVEQII